MSRVSKALQTSQTNKQMKYSCSSPTRLDHQQQIIIETDAKRRLQEVDSLEELECADTNYLSNMSQVQLKKTHRNTSTLKKHGNFRETSTSPNFKQYPQKSQQKTGMFKQLDDITINLFHNRSHNQELSGWNNEQISPVPSRNSLSKQDKEENKSMKKKAQMPLTNDNTPQNKELKTFQKLKQNQLEHWSNDKDIKQQSDFVDPQNYRVMNNNPNEIQSYIPQLDQSYYAKSYSGIKKYSSQLSDLKQNFIQIESVIKSQIPPDFHDIFMRNQESRKTELVDEATMKMEEIDFKISKSQLKHKSSNLFSKRAKTSLSIDVSRFKVGEGYFSKQEDKEQAQYDLQKNQQESLIDNQNDQSILKREKNSSRVSYHEVQEQQPQLSWRPTYRTSKSSQATRIFGKKKRPYSFINQITASNLKNQESSQNIASQNINSSTSEMNIKLSSEVISDQIVGSLGNGTHNNQSTSLNQCLNRSRLNSNSPDDCLKQRYDYAENTNEKRNQKVVFNKDLNHLFDQILQKCSEERVEYPKIIQPIPNYQNKTYLNTSSGNALLPGKLKVKSNIRSKKQVASRYAPPSSLQNSIPSSPFEMNNKIILAESVNIIKQKIDSNKEKDSSLILKQQQQKKEKQPALLGQENNCQIRFATGPAKGSQPKRQKDQDHSQIGFF